MSLIIFILVVYGFTNIVVNESIVRKPVDWLKSKSNFLNKMLGCGTCTGFWVGMIFFLLMPFSISGLFLLDILLAGFISSGVNNIIDHIKIRLKIIG